MKKPPIEQRDWMTVQEVADELVLSSQTIRDWIKSGRLKAEWISNRTIRVPKAELEKLKSEWTIK